MTDRYRDEDMQREHDAARPLVNVDKRTVFGGLMVVLIGAMVLGVFDMRDQVVRMQSERAVLDRTTERRITILEERAAQLETWKETLLARLTAGGCDDRRCTAIERHMQRLDDGLRELDKRGGQ